MEIITRKITEEEIEVYINLLMSKIDSWSYSLHGPSYEYDKVTSIAYSKGRYNEEFAEQIIGELKSLYEEKSNSIKLKSRLIELFLIPEYIYLVEDSEILKSLPIYTRVSQLGKSSVIMEAFFNNEKHLLNSQGRILFCENYHDIEIAELDGKQILIRRESDTEIGTSIFYDNQFIGDCSIAFQSEPDVCYTLSGEFNEFPNNYYKKFNGNGKIIVFENLPLGKYYIKKNDKKILEKSIGQFMEDSGEFTIKNLCFPDFSQKYEYDSLLSEIEKADSPKETALKIISDLEQKQFQDLFLISSIYPYLPKYLREDFEIILSIFLINLKIENNEAEFVPNTLQELSQAIIQNQKFIRENKNKIIIDIPSVNEATEALSENIKNFLYKNIGHVKEIIFFFPHILAYANQDIKSDKEIAIQAVKQNGYTLEYLSEELKSDKELVLEAVNQDGGALKYASEYLKSDRELVKIALLSSKNPVDKFDNYVLNLFSTDREIMTLYVNQNKYNIKDVSDELLTDRDYFNSLIGEGFKKGLHIGHLYYSQSEKSIFKEYLKDKDLVKRMLHNYPGDIDKVDESFKSDRDILFAIISQKNGYGNYIKYGNDQIKNDKEILELAVSDSVYNIKYAGEIILEDNNFLLEIIKKYPGCFNHLPVEVRNKIETKMIEMGIQDIIVNKSETKFDSNSNKGNDEDDDMPF
jgi:hypothetical protein